MCYYSMVDLTPFGFTSTESLVYAVLLRIGPSTGYAVAQAGRLARANAYSALEGLVKRGAAARTPGSTRPVLYRPTDPQALLAQLATLQGEALDRLGRELRDLSHPKEPITREISGSRAIANLILQLVARAERSIQGLLAADLWRPTLPAWRRAGERASLDVAIVGELPADAPPWLKAVSRKEPNVTMLIIDESQLVLTMSEGGPDSISGLWSSHPLVVMIAQRALTTMS